MTDVEFDLMDELYFVQPFENIQETLKWQEELLLTTLQSLYSQGYIKCLETPDHERFDEVDVLKDGKKLFFLATKKGLMAHNSI
ncbi:MAG: hypothetical protein PSV36_03645 [Algoriphagus sp.]|nr:hypothetical protein [Algoriphagus sp.]